MVSMLSRAAAPPATNELATLVAALLSNPVPSTNGLLDPAGVLGTAPTTQLLGGPSGIGTSAARIGQIVNGHSASAGTATLAPSTEAVPDTGAGDSAVPELYCPPALRDDPALGTEVNERLVEWAEEIGIYPGQSDVVRKAEFGRLIMLAHPESDDPDRLLAAAKCALAEWSVDDHYVDGEAEEAVPELLGQRLAIAYSAIDPAYLAASYAPDLERVLREDVVMRALRNSIGNLANYATPSQVARLRHELSVMFVAYNQEGVWRATDQRPPVWEYLMHRHENSFLPCMVLIDAVGGYELPPGEFADPRVRKAFAIAGSASVILNDLYSMGKEDPTDTNLPRLIAAEENCSLREAIDRSVEIHDEMMHRFEREAAAISLVGSPALRRFLAGVWAWLGGSREWHSRTGRYNAEASNAEASTAETSDPASEDPVPDNLQPGNHEACAPEAISP